MFKKILIANRGEIAVRIVRTCREMGIATVALYIDSDRGSLHVRLADECVRLEAARDLFNPVILLAIAQEHGADAIHPGYGFLAEEAYFIRACQAAGITFIGPPPQIIEPLRSKIYTLKAAREAGFRTPEHSHISFGAENYNEIIPAAEALGYPVIIKSCSGGRGRGARIAYSTGQLEEAVRQAQVIGYAIYGNPRVYLEKAFMPAYQVGVQILADKNGSIIHLGDREGSILQKGHKIVEESPSTCLNEEQRQRLWETALALGRHFKYENLGTVEFVIDHDGQFYFTEFKSRIQVQHPLTEMLTRIDLVSQQIRIAAGEELSLRQEDIMLDGWAMMCRVRANDPWNDYMSSPGKLKRVRLPGGPQVRVDTYVYCNCEVPAQFGPLLANLSVWGENRELCLQRLKRALEDFTIIGTPTNLPLLQWIIDTPEFASGDYSTAFKMPEFNEPLSKGDEHLSDLAIAAAVMYLHRSQMVHPQSSERLQGGWHHSSRQLPR
jgi:acetyl/propionyl-CoA carboxylase alpha subunit